MKNKGVKEDNFKVQGLNKLSSRELHKEDINMICYYAYDIR